MFVARELIQDRLAFFNKYMNTSMSVAATSKEAQATVAGVAGARLSKYKIAMRMGGPELAVQDEASFNQLVKSASSVFNPNATMRAIQEERARNSGAIATAIDVYGRYGAGSMLKVASYNMDAQGRRVAVT